MSLCPPFDGEKNVVINNETRAYDCAVIIAGESRLNVTLTVRTHANNVGQNALMASQ